LDDVVITAAASGDILRYNGTNWVDAVGTTHFDAAGTAAGLVDDLSGVTNAATARSNLGLGDAATKNVGTTAGTVAAGDDGRFTDARTPTAHAASHQDGGADELALDGSQITAGTVATARLGSGTSDAFTFLDGTGAWVADVPVFVAIKNTTASTITKGAALVATGSVGASGAVEVGLADADDPTKMPAIGLAATDIVAGASGHAVVTGMLRGISTTGYSINAPAYVSTTAGQLTPTRPTGTSELVQNIGRVVRVHGSTGEILVLGPGRSNDIPNSIDGAAITTGTVATARLGTGTPSSSNFLRGDGSWQTVSGTVDVVSNVATSTILGRITAGSGDSEELTAAQTRTLLGVAAATPVGASTWNSVQNYSLPGVMYDALANAFALTANTIRYMPFRIPDGTTLAVDRIWFEVTTLQAGSNARIGVWAADINWQPTGAPLIDATTTTATTGAKNITVSATLTAGRYIAGIVSDANISCRAGIARVSWGSDHSGTAVAAGGSSQMITNRRVALTYPGTMPTPGPAWTATDTSATNTAGDLLILLRGTFS
jgi:hypothetical protein